MSIIAPDQMHTWPEAVIVSQPLRNPEKPTVLVRRRIVDMEGPNGEELVYVAGNPAISLFTGAGGMDLGLEQAGFISLCQHEWNQTACETLIANRPKCFRHSALIQGDIRETPTSMLLESTGLEVGETHLVCGGPPCQGFSMANSHRGKKKDERNDLVFEYLRVVREAKPKFFIFENVPGFLGFNKNAYVKAFLKAAYECYYDLVYGLVDCCDYGVPQRRVRFICMGTRRDLSETKGFIAALPAPQFFSGNDLKVVRAAEKSRIWTPEAKEIMRAPGVRYFPDRPVLIPPHPNHGEDGRSQSHLEFYRRIEQEEPDRLITTPKGPQE